jgi:sugar/nucleoside kinase (ribokinase family)
MTSEKSGDPILIVGSMAFDDLDLPTGSERDVVGGSATYASLAASLLAPARVVAVVGDDFPGAVLERLSQKGIDIAGIERARGKTFRWAGRYAQNLASRTTLDTQLNVFADFRPTLPDSYKNSPIVFLGNIHPTLQLEVLGQTSSPRFVAMDTMNFWIEGERSALGEVLRRIDALVINDEELRQLAQEHNITRAAREVIGLGPKRLIVKRGEYGAMLFDEEGVFFAPAFPLEDEIDPTGAGDTFAGALLGHLAQAKKIDHDALRRALIFAAAVASFCVEDVGTRRLERLTREEVSKRLELLHRLTLVPA